MCYFLTRHESDNTKPLIDKFGGSHDAFIFKSDILKKKIRLNVTIAALRTVDYKGGIDFYLKSVKSFKLSTKAKKLKNRVSSYFNKIKFENIVN